MRCLWQVSLRFQLGKDLAVLKIKEFKKPKPTHSSLKLMIDLICFVGSVSSNTGGRLTANLGQKPNLLPLAGTREFRHVAETRDLAAVMDDFLGCET